ncbi:NUDIX domain-containing protein [Streptomyces sp. NBC_01478]|uniref:glycosyltransferase n=1 Tax=Streptomyces sp. NBC_01478 TaxID=2903882 RepID=UPI002E355011|nr:NUDIX domain-containing protein [Streptomyces sp. NBC_01478]
MHIIECHFEFSGFDDRLVKAGTSVYLWNLARQFRDAGHRVGAVTPAHGLLPLLREHYEVVDLDWRTDDEIPVRLDPAEWPGHPETVRLPVSARAHRMTVDGIDIVLLSGGVLDTHPDSFYPPPRLKGHDLAYLKPLVFQVVAARYVREQVAAGTVVHLHEPVHHHLLPALLAGRGLHVVSTVQTNLAVDTKVYGPGVRSVLAHEGADVSVADGLADPPLDGFLERAMRAYLPRTLLHRDSPTRPGHDYVPVLALVSRSVAALDFLSDGQLAHMLSQAGTPFEQLFRHLTVRRELRARTGLMTVGGCAIGDEWLDVRRSEERRKRTLDTLALDPDLPTVFHNARYSVQHKGQKELFRGVRRLLDEGHRVNVLLHCLSPTPPGDEDLEALAREHPDRVRVRTDPMDTSEIQDWATAADFCVFPSKFEMDTFLMAMGEAMAAGCVPLATAQQGMRHFGQSADLDAPGATGLALPRSFRVDDEELTEAVRSGLLRLLELWRTDPARIEALRANAVAAGRSFTWKAAAERFLAVFAACAEGTRPADATPVVREVIDADAARRPFPAGRGHAHRTGDTVRIEWRGEDLARVEVVPAGPEPHVLQLTANGGTFTGQAPYAPALALLVTARDGRSSWHELPVTVPEITATSSTVVYRNRWMTVREDTTLRPDGTTGLYGVVHKPDFAVVLPYAAGGFHLVEQYRYPVKGRYWEFPQGSWEDRPDIDPLELARAELAEETGLTAAVTTRIGHLFAAYGYSDQGFHVVLATGLTQGEPDPEPEEAGLRSRWFPTEEVWRLVAEGRFKDAPSLAALALFARHQETDR